MEKGKVNFEVVLKEASSLPGIRIDRDDFLRKQLQKYCDDNVVQAAIETSPHNAGISLKLIEKIAKDCMTYETNKVSAISFATGIPGGLTMIGTVPADIVQYFGHVLRIVQKLAYLYGWESLFASDGKMDDETANLMTLFIGVMFGVNGAAGVLTKVAEKASEKVYKTLVAKALTKGTVFPIVKKVAQILGIQMTKQIFARTVSKAVPIIGGAASGGLTYATYRPMASKLRKYFHQLEEAKEKKEKAEVNA